MSMAHISNPVVDQPPLILFVTLKSMELLNVLMSEFIQHLR